MVVVVGAVTGDVGGLVGDVALPCLGPGLLLVCITSMVVVGGVVLWVVVTMGNHGDVALVGGHGGRRR